ncbi:MAG: glycosyltransferase family 2 protein [Clostridiales bacterium]|nr:glycosyltransferase family 2 protein [Clostridiales bacterium]
MDSYSFPDEVFFQMGLGYKMISVAMTTFNGMPYVKQQLESILIQLDESDELVVSDNGSTDGTWAWLEKQAVLDKRIVLIQFFDEQGVVANVFNALKHCHGDLIFLSDQDDVWLPGRVSTVVRQFDANPDLLIVQTDAVVIDQSGKTITDSFFDFRHCGPGILKNIYKNTWQGCCMAMRRQLLALALPVPKSVPMHDVWLGLIAECSGQVAFLPKILTQYRRHLDNASALKHAPWHRVVGWRIALITALLWRLPRILWRKIAT